ncbi:MAG: PBP1A family penicillin-binding protein [Epsilonproteobacteria bacterium]|nr:PBP1A family penicillin-binding protein [Campylobacterota bacterium]
MISVATENKFADISSYRMPSSSIIYASDGEIIASFGYQQRKIIPLKSVAKIAIDAVVATEDSRFFEHGPIDFKGILRALVSDIISGKFSEGGSTITQQLVKNIFLSPEKSIYRKTVEVVLAYKMENRYSKKKILELYLNEIYFGNGSYGIEDAAERYFGVSADHLNLLESAALAGVIEAPSRYNLYRHPKLARERISHVLKRMYELGKITEKQYQNALNGNLKLRSKSIPSWAYGYFTEYVRQKVIRMFGEKVLYNGGLRVYTTLNPLYQKIATTEVKKGLIRLRRKGSMPQGAALVIRQHTGEILAMVGGFSFRISPFNRAYQARRQVGSAFKPIVYTAAIANGFSPNDMLLDEPISFKFHNKVWTPENYERKYRGNVTLRYALAHSINIATINLIAQIGINETIKYARKLGITSALPRNYTLALGSASLSAFELATAYGTIANYGVRKELYAIKKITGPNGRVYYSHKDNSKRVLKVSTGFIMTKMLQEVIESGTGRAAKVLGVPLAGKTGTTNDYKNAWFAGYSPDYLTVVWTGYDNGKSLGRGETGARAALPIWIGIMRGIMRGSTSGRFPIPPNLPPETLKILNRQPQLPENVEGNSSDMQNENGFWKEIR